VFFFFLRNQLVEFGHGFLEYIALQINNKQHKHVCI